MPQNWEREEICIVTWSYNLCARLFRKKFASIFATLASEGGNDTKVRARCKSHIQIVEQVLCGKANNHNNNNYVQLYQSPISIGIIWIVNPVR